MSSTPRSVELDELSLDRAHLVGNSMGGWIALDLARRGRALSVCAISPAGMWSPGGASSSRARLRQGLRMGRLTRPVLPVLYRSARIRRFALRNVAANGASVPRDRALELTYDMLGCRIAEDMLTTQEWFAPLDPAPCPITIAWCQLDRIFAESEFGARAKERVPGARYAVLGNVGHVPMLDDPKLVAAVIRESLDATMTSPTP